MKLYFLGATRTVTGSQYLIYVGNKRILIDCGLYQGHNPDLVDQEHFLFDPATVDHLLLTHAHIDHCGLIPRLVKLGFKGEIHTTSATADLCNALLLDSAKIQEEDVKWELRKWRKGQQNTPPPAPLYTIEDAEKSLHHFAPCQYDERVQICEGVEARWVEAGHILGAACIEIWLTESSQQRKIVFSGDIGNPGRPILRDPAMIDQADFVVMESTYGDRLHPSVDEGTHKLAEAVRMSLKAHGHLIIPAFAVGRTQEILYRLDHLLTGNLVPPIKVFVDSPLASKATQVFYEHPECFDAETQAQLKSGDNPLQFPSLHFTASADESRQLNLHKESCVIISASGMCTAGRIRHHLHHHLEHGNDVILFTGFQAQGTLGRILVEGAKEVKLFGRKQRVRARIVSIRGLSAHADQKGLLTWAEAMQGVATYFITHGEERATLHFARLLNDRNHPVAVPTLGQGIDLLDEAALLEMRTRTLAELPATTMDKTSPDNVVESEEA